MGRNYQLEELLKSGRGCKITGVIFTAAALILTTVSIQTENEIFLAFLPVFLISALLFFIIGFTVSSNKKKTIDGLDRNGEIDAAIEDYYAETTVKLDKKGRIAIGSKYLYSLGSGRIINYKDILLTYIGVNRQNGIPVSQMLIVCTADGKRGAVVNEKMSEAGKVKLNSYIAYIKERNPDCMVGYTRENAKAYRAAVKKYRAEH